MKNSTTFLFFCLVLLSQLTACSQENENECKTLLNQQPYIFKQRQQSNMNIDSVKQDYIVLQECGNLDSIDAIIFQGPLLGQLLVAQTDKQEFNEITYQVLIDLITEFKKDKAEHYQKLRNVIIVNLEIERKPVELTEYESIRPKLKAAGLTNEEINAFKAFLDANNKTWNYKEAMTAFIQSKKTTASSTKPLDFPNLQTLEKLLEDAKTKNTNCLLYFSGYGCVNARKFESQALTNLEIQQFIRENFSYAVALVDDRQKLPGETKTNGEKYSQLQKQKFNTEAQPYLYILSPEGKIIAEWSYTDGINSFKDFLEKGMKK